jgi:hypothetical protein
VVSQVYTAAGNVAGNGDDLKEDPAKNYIAGEKSSYPIDD